MTSPVLTAEQISSFTSALWQTTQNQPESRPSESAMLRRVLSDLPDGEAAHRLRVLVDSIETLDPAERRMFTASIDEVQVRSKLWLIEELSARRDLDGVTMVVLGAWYGILSLLLNLHLPRPPGHMVNVDISPDAVELGRRVVGPLYGNVEYHVADAMELDYAALVRRPGSVLVNTICEHLAEGPLWWSRVAPGQLSALQSNNYEKCSEHVNCVDDVEQLEAQTPMSRRLYSGTLELSIFDRFMLIGYR